MIYYFSNFLPSAQKVMRPTYENAVDELLGDDNYCIWEFNARMKLGKKGLLTHIEKSESISKDLQLRQSGKSATLKLSQSF